MRRMVLEAACHRQGDSYSECPSVAETAENPAVWEDPSLHVSARTCTAPQR